jgi:hypothetical protein
MDMCIASKLFYNLEPLKKYLKEHFCTIDNML